MIPRMTSSARRSASVTSDPSGFQLTVQLRNTGRISASAASASARAKSSMWLEGGIYVIRRQSLKIIRGQRHHVTHHKKCGRHQLVGVAVYVTNLCPPDLFIGPGGPRNQRGRQIR